MTQSIAQLRSFKRYGMAMFAAACMTMLATQSTRADLIIAVENVTASAGDTGGGLDVTLTNTGPSAVDIGGFNFEIIVGGTDITLTDVTTATTLAPYIFDGLGLNGPNIGTIVTNQDIMASDVFSVIGSGTTVSAGATVGLGRVVFNVSNSASGAYAVQLVTFPATSLSDFSGNDVAITSLVNGSISLRGVPEPTSLGLLSLGVVFMGVFAVRRRRTRQV